MSWLFIVLWAFTFVGMMGLQIITVVAIQGLEEQIKLLKKGKK